jgi:NADH:ubiquinone oxidoreductase subunit E
MMKALTKWMARRAQRRRERRKAVVMMMDEHGWRKRQRLRAAAEELGMTYEAVKKLHLKPREKPH